MDVHERKRMLARRTLAKFGPGAQMDRLQEEAGEVIVEVAHLRRLPNKLDAAAKLIREIADMEIVIASIRELFGDLAVDEALAEKLSILEQRLDDPEYQ